MCRVSDPSTSVIRPSIRAGRSRVSPRKSCMSPRVASSMSVGTVISGRILALSSSRWTRSARRVDDAAPHDASSDRHRQGSSAMSLMRREVSAVDEQRPRWCSRRVRPGRRRRTVRAAPDTAAPFGTTDANDPLPSASGRTEQTANTGSSAARHTMSMSTGPVLRQRSCSGERPSPHRAGSRRPRRTAGHVMFATATTDPQTVLPTILSCAQHRPPSRP